MLLATPIGVGVGVDSSSSKEGSGPSGFFEGVIEEDEAALRLAPRFDKRGLGVVPEPYREPAPIRLLLREGGGLAVGTGAVVGGLRSGDPGRGKDGRRAVGFNAGLAALAPGPTDWLNFAVDGVRPPALNVDKDGPCGVAGPRRTAFSIGRKMPEPGFVVLK